MFYAFLTGWLCDRWRILHQYFTALICCRNINVSPYTSIAGVGVCFLIPRVDLRNCRFIFSRSLTLLPAYHISLLYFNMGSIWQSKTLNSIAGDNLPTTGRDSFCREKMLYQLDKQHGKTFLSVHFQDIYCYIQPQSIYVFQFFPDLSSNFTFTPHPRSFACHFYRVPFQSCAISTPRKAYSPAAILANLTYRTHCHLCPTRYSFSPESSEKFASKVTCPRSQYRNNFSRLKGEKRDISLKILHQEGFKIAWHAATLAKCHTLPLNLQLVTVSYNILFNHLKGFHNTSMW